MLKPGTEMILSMYCKKYPEIAAIQESLKKCTEMLTVCFQNGGKLLICGNGGSCADADHIVGELAKPFRMDRPLEAELCDCLSRQGESGILLSQHLQAGLPAINLGAHAALITATANDIGGDYIYAQQVVAYGHQGDILLGISTSGNSKNISYAGVTAKAKGMQTVGLTGKNGGRMSRDFDLILCADAENTEDIQDLHSAIYHAVCSAVEYQCWGKTTS